MTWPELEYSKSQVKRAGKILREHNTQILSQSENDVAWATSVARNWRQAHAEAENSAQMGVGAVSARSASRATPPSG